VIIDPPQLVRVLDEGGRTVLVSDRGAILSAPARYSRVPDAVEPAHRGTSTGRAAPAGRAALDSTAPDSTAPDSTAPDSTALDSAITAWAGPWPVDERWWDPESARRLARMQLVDVSGRAYLVCFDLGTRQWLLEGVYD
jgi:protein ImuB